MITFPNAPHRIINAVRACLAGTNAVCKALLAVSVLEWEGTENSKRADDAVMIIQLLALVGGLPVLAIVTVVFFVVFVCCEFCPRRMCCMYIFQTI